MFSLSFVGIHQETRRIEAAGGTVQAMRRGNFTTYRVNGSWVNVLRLAT